MRPQLAKPARPTLEGRAGAVFNASDRDVFNERYNERFNERYNEKFNERKYNAVITQGRLTWL